jgi:hypothetical protein
MPARISRRTLLPSGAETSTSEDCEIIFILVGTDGFLRCQAGGLAHSSAGAVAAPDPLTELTALHQLMSGLFKLDRILARLR